MKTIQKFNYYSQTFERKGLPYRGWNLWNYIYIYIYSEVWLQMYPAPERLL